MDPSSGEMESEVSGVDIEYSPVIVASLTATSGRCNAGGG